MVLGAYTIISTLGLTAGLPYPVSNQTYNLTYNENSFNSYLSKYFENDINKLDNNSYLIIDFDNSNISNPQFISVELKYGDNALSYSYTEHIDNYYLFSYSQTFTKTISGLALYFTQYSSSFSANINQVYLGIPTSKLPTFDGDTVLGAISSGLGLIPELAKNFGSSFERLIWNSETSKLTTFGNFALIFLGVSITFSIVKLCLSLIRSKTGA